MLGRDLDAHTDAFTQVGRTLAATISPAMSSEHQCIVGRECYASNLRIMLVACVVALGLSTWAGIRRWKARNE